jgi:hypothetical protein
MSRPKQRKLKSRSSLGLPSRERQVLGDGRLNDSGIMLLVLAIIDDESALVSDSVVS